MCGFLLGEVFTPCGYCLIIRLRLPVLRIYAFLTCYRPQERDVGFGEEFSGTARLIVQREIICTKPQTHCLFTCAHAFLTVICWIAASLYLGGLSGRAGRYETEVPHVCRYSTAGKILNSGKPGPATNVLIQ
jgi:hypothetical protein